MGAQPPKTGVTSPELTPRFSEGNQETPKAVVPGVSGSVPAKAPRNGGSNSLSTESARKEGFVEDRRNPAEMGGSHAVPSGACVACTKDEVAVGQDGKLTLAGQGTEVGACQEAKSRQDREIGQETGVAMSGEGTSEDWEVQVDRREPDQGQGRRIKRKRQSGNEEEP